MPELAAAEQCTRPGCPSIREPQQGPEAGLCARHRQEARQRRGACLNCGAGLRAEPELNQLTGRPLVRDGEVVLVYTCEASCGYTRRSRPSRNRRLR